MRSLIFLASVVLASALPAQCPRPDVPSGGLPVQTHPPEQVTYSDGVVAEGWLIEPLVTPPSCGWPLVIYVHSLGQFRTQDSAWQAELAGMGFAVWSYGVRGQGRTRVLSPQAGTTLYGPTERYDLAEQIAHAGSRASVDGTRVGIYGDSQGGIHGWMAAAQSEQELIVPGRGTLIFPKVSCVVGADYVSEPIEHRVRNDALFVANFIDLVTLDPSTQPFLVDSTFANAATSHFLAQDPAGLEAMLRGEVGRLVELGQTQVPILFNHAWHDSLADPGLILDGQRPPAGTPFRLVMSTVGHGVPKNDYEVRFKQELALRWFERFLWSETNGVELEARVVSARMPLDPSLHASASTLWPHAFDETFPPADVTPVRWFTTAGGALDLNEPATRGDSSIVHRVDPSFTPTVWVNDPTSRSVANITTKMPLSQHRFVVTAAEDHELAGRPRLHLRVEPNASHFTVAALLSVILPGSQDERMIAHGASGRFDAVPGEVVDLEFDLSPVFVSIPAGAEVVLKLQNHWRPEAPHVDGFVTVPWFNDSDVLIAHGSGADSSWLELPERREARVSLTTDALRIDPLAAQAVDLEIDAGRARAGKRFLLAVSLSGQVPGIALPGGELPVREDFATITFGSLVNTPELINFVGALDAEGRATAALDLTGVPPFPELMDERITLAAWTYRNIVDLTGTSSNPIDIRFR